MAKEELLSTREGGRRARARAHSRSVLFAKLLVQSSRERERETLQIFWETLARSASRKRIHCHERAI